MRPVQSNERRTQHGFAHLRKRQRSLQGQPFFTMHQNNPPEPDSPVVLLVTHLITGQTHFLQSNGSRSTRQLDHDSSQTLTMYGADARLYAAPLTPPNHPNIGFGGINGEYVLYICLHQCRDQCRICIYGINVGIWSLWDFFRTPTLPCSSLAQPAVFSYSIALRILGPRVAGVWTLKTLSRPFPLGLDSWDALYCLLCSMHDIE